MEEDKTSTSTESCDGADECGEPSSGSREEAAAHMSSNREKALRSSSGDASRSADRKLVQDVLKRYTEVLEARTLATDFNERKRSKQTMPGNVQPLDSDRDSNRKRQKIAATTEPVGSVGKSKRKHPLPQDIKDPLDVDVLFGRRDAQRFHPGNVLLRALCDTYRTEYETGDREVKTVVKKRIIEEISSKGGRFLKRKPDATTWYSVDEEVALEKVAFTMRDTRDKKETRSRMITFSVH